MTRAEKGLYLSDAEGWNLDGSPRYPSRFILDIDPSLLRYDKPPQESLIRDAREYIEASERYLPESRESNVLSIGQRVSHAVFGSGTVVDVDTDRGAHIVQFDDMPTPRAISFKAKLEKLNE